MIYFYVKITFAKEEGLGSRKSTVIRLEYFGGKEIQSYASNHCHDPWNVRRFLVLG